VESVRLDVVVLVVVLACSGMALGRRIKEQEADREGALLHSGELGWRQRLRSRDPGSSKGRTGASGRAL
jgi:uncharacterized protein with beta-barrel porin domain